MQVELVNGIIQLQLSHPREMELLNTAARELAARLAGEALENRNYHMGTKPTPGRGYDDRLTMRLGFSATTCYEYLRLDPKRGGLAGRQVGTKWLVTEEAVRDFEGRKTKQAA
ncbi:hypothetical protein [Hymenobacter convexus]|uniref:hypothetical protein n=1 Tax=Hymenobacter sp. CA1UV-4 TaxID=3063782 RepID=UPI002712D176|nr:hypothetical protein [Hymenobacter sp. CA1UV-4]MDO7851376.1 hypothetical protein [Hymenobacter sp. CA1UV-4]